MAWAQFYGWIKGRAVTKASRIGNKDTGLSLCAASKTGAITVELMHWEGKDCFEIRFVPWGESSFDEIPLARGSFVAGEEAPTVRLNDDMVRAHVEAMALKAMTKED